jgi:hypothetical protein
MHGSYLKSSRALTDRLTPLAACRVFTDLPCLRSLRPSQFCTLLLPLCLRKRFMKWVLNSRRFSRFLQLAAWRSWHNNCMARDACAEREHVDKMYPFRRPATRQCKHWETLWENGRRERKKQQTHTHTHTHTHNEGGNHDHQAGRDLQSGLQ